MTGTCVVVASLIGSDPETADRFRELRGVLHLAAVRGPSIRRPDLPVVANADHQRLGRDPHLIAQVLRDEDASLLVEVGLERTGEDRPLEEPAGGIRQRDARILLLERRPAVTGVDRQAAVDPAGQHRAALELRPEARRDREPSLVVHRVPVLAGEHPPCSNCREFDEPAGSAGSSSVSRRPECPSVNRWWWRRGWRSGDSQVDPHYSPLRTTWTQ